MKPKPLFLAVVLLLVVSAHAQLASFSFSGTGACPTQGNSATAPGNVTVSAVTRTSGLTCQPLTDYFSTSAWTTATTVNTAQYLELTITPAANYKLNLTSLSLTMQKDSNGPVNARISHNGGTATFTAQKDVTLTTTVTPVSWDFTDFSSTSGGAVKVRIYGWSAVSSAGLMNISQLAIYGTITNSPASTPGITTQRLEVAGNIVSGGQVMIGNVDAATMGDYTLAVNGNAIVKKLVVMKASAPWPDYVFDKNYQLTPLDSLRLFITQNNHLPGVPSAAEVESKGIDISHTQSALLKKIEELTLYIINQDKKQQAVEQQLLQLQEELTSVKKNIKSK